MEAEGLLTERPRALGVFAVPLGEEARRRVFPLVGELRRAGLAADMAFGGRGVKGAMKAADRSGARYALILGDRDIEAGTAQVKDLTTADQTAVPLAEVVEFLKGKLS